MITSTITGLEFNLTTATGTIINFYVKIGTTALTTLTTTLVSTSSMTSVYSAASVTPTVGSNVYSFTTPFNWDGVSNIIINTCQTNSVSGTTTISAYTPSFASQVYKAGATTSCTDVTGTAVATAPVVTLYGQIGTNLTSSLAWSWNDGTINVGGTTATTTAATTTVGSVMDLLLPLLQLVMNNNLLLCLPQ